MSIEIEKWCDENDGELSEEAMRAKLTSRGYNVTRYCYRPGCYFPPHVHDVDKIDGVLSGRFLMRMAGEELILEAGDMLTVPRGERHSAEVVGDKVVVSLDVVKRS